MDRLDQVGVRPLLQAVQAVLQGAARRQQHDADLPARPQLLGDGEAVFPRQADVDHRHVAGLGDLRAVELGPVGKAACVEAELAEAVHHFFAKVLLVLDQVHTQGFDLYCHGRIILL